MSQEKDNNFYIPPSSSTIRLNNNNLTQKDNVIPELDNFSSENKENENFKIKSENSEKNVYLYNIDKIKNRVHQVGVENIEVNETSTCPSKLKNRSDSRKRRRRKKSEDSSSSSSSSNSSYHNRKKKLRKSESRVKDRSRGTSRSRRKNRSTHRKNNRRDFSKSRRRSNSVDKRRKVREWESGRTRNRNRDRRDRKSNQYSRKYDNSSSESSYSESSESTIKKKNYFEERRKARKTSRSNSALRVMKMKNLENACGYYQRFYQRPHEDNDPKKPQLYWDGYQWVIRPNSLSEHNFDIIKPGRKVQIANVPLHLNIQVNHFKDFLISKIQEGGVVSTKDVKDINNIIRGIELDYENNSAVLAMESTEVAKRMVLIDGIILLGHTLRLSPYQDINDKDEGASNIAKAQALANSAHLSAKSAAIAFAALKSLGNKSENVQINLQGDHKTTLPSSKVLKVMNLIDYKEVSKIKSDRFDEILDDIKDEFGKFGNIVSSLIIRSKVDKIGAECGSVFVEFQDSKFAENATKAMKGKLYEGREIKLAYIDENVFKKEIL